LMMTKPYKEGGTYINGFDIKGLRTKVKIYGTLNSPSDEDEKWTIEMAIPFKSLINHPIKTGDVWRMNFSRVEWLKRIIENGRYKKIKGKEGFGSEENWVWASTGLVDIHMPEKWGFVTFSEK
ncbi:MAG: carbohydrate-binding family 9-like protein, partial [Chitinophagaceae bacterium]